jgi:hypothetical protein
VTSRPNRFRDAGTGRKPQDPRSIAILFSERPQYGASLVVLRPDHDGIGYRMDDSTPVRVLALAHDDGVRVVKLRHVSKCPRWAMLALFRHCGWQLNWVFRGWGYVIARRASADAEEGAAA